MKQIIKGRKYDTDTATELGDFWNGRSNSDFRHISETLYRKTNGEFFIHGEGGPLTEYAQPVGDMTGGSEQIRPLSDSEARAWVEDHLDADDYEAIFGTVAEDQGLKISDRDFYTIWCAAQEEQDKDAFVSDWVLSSLFEGQMGEDIDVEIMESITKIWDVAHMTAKDIREVTGLSQVRFSERFCVPRRTVEGWESKDSCPPYVKLMLARQLGLI